MKNTFKFSARATAAAAVLALGSSAFAVTFDANLELDNTYRNGSYVGTADQGLSQGGRVEMNAAGKAGANLFVAGRASFLAKKDGTAGTDDMWVQFGSATSALKLGRFEAADLFPLVGDTLINHAGAVYVADPAGELPVWHVLRKYRAAYRHRVRARPAEGICDLPAVPGAL